MWWWHDGCNWWMGFGWLFWIIVVLLVIWIVRGSEQRRYWRHYGQQFPQHETALDILKKRYAKGEITKEEFDRMKRDLQA